MEKIRKSRDELERELGEQIEALRAANQGFDDGRSWQAKWIASTIYILCFDGTGRTKSLLGLLGLKDRMEFLSSLHILNPDVPMIATMACPLVMVRISGEGATHVPLLGEDPLGVGPRSLPFSKWWEEKVFHPATKIPLTRKNLVFMMRTKDGGGHVDDHFADLNHRILKTEGDPALRQFPGGISIGGPPAAGKPLGTYYPQSCVNSGGS